MSDFLKLRWYEYEAASLCASTAFLNMAVYISYGYSWALLLCGLSLGLMIAVIVNGIVNQ